MTSHVSPRVLGWLLALATVVGVMVNQRDVGLARDELVYMQAGAKYATWWTGLVTRDHGVSRAGITATFGGRGATDHNREHPPLVKTLSGLSRKLFTDRLHVMDEVSAHRLPTALLHGLLVLLVFGMTSGLWGTAEAVVAALCVMLLPRAVFHAGLTAFDAPIMTLWFATVVAYWRALDGRRWPWQAGVVFGLALATKHNALLLPLALGVHYLVVGWRADRGRGLVLHRWRVIVSLAVLAPLTLVAVWPWLWFEPVAHVRDWITFHLTHVHYNFEYLGHNWNAPRFPWHVALVTTLVTVPVVTLVAGALGAAVWATRGEAAPDRARAPGLLLALSAAASIGPFVLGSTPIFGAEKHWMPALPSLCIAAGVGLVWAARLAIAVLGARLGGRWHAPALAAILALALAGPAVETVTAQPYALTWYSAAVGGAPGGADLGMNRQFWGVAAKGVLPFLAADAATAPPGLRSVYTHDAAPAWGLYQKLGLVPRALLDAGWEQVGIGSSTWALVIHERHFNRHDYLIWAAYGTVQPVFVLRSDGVPIVSVYRRPR